MLGHPGAQDPLHRPDVGGGFGSQDPATPTRRWSSSPSKAHRGRPVKWIEDRRENYQATIHGRDHIKYVEMAATKDGDDHRPPRQGLRRTSARTLSTVGPGIPTTLHGLMLSGAYTIPNIHGEVTGVYTNTTPVDAYRGAGRPEATYVVERRDGPVRATSSGMDPAEIRRRNFIPPDAFPYTVATGARPTTPATTSRRSTRRSRWSTTRASRKEQEAGAQEGPATSASASSTYIEICGLGPSQVVGAVGFGGGLWESAIVAVHPTGKVASTSALSRTARATRRPSRRSSPTSSASRWRTSRSSTATPRARRWAGAPTAAAPPSVGGSAHQGRGQQDQGEGEDARGPPARGRGRRHRVRRTASSR